MENKIRQLTDKLYEEGLLKGKTEAETILSEAKKEAEKIIANANKKGEDILAAAQKRDEEMSRTAQKDVQMAANRVVAETKEGLKNMLSGNIINTDLTRVFSNTNFVGELVTSIVDNWSKQDVNSSAKIVIPQDKEEEFKQYVTSKSIESLKANMEIVGDSRVKSGFRVASGDNGFYISFSDEQFNNFFMEYLKKEVSDLLFSEQK